MFLEHQISLLEWFLVTLKTGVMLVKIQLCHHRNKLPLKTYYNRKQLQLLLYLWSNKCILDEHKRNQTKIKILHTLERVSVMSTQTSRDITVSNNNKFVLYSTFLPLCEEGRRERSQIIPRFLTVVEGRTKVPAMLTLSPQKWVSWLHFLLYSGYPCWTMTGCRLGSSVCQSFWTNFLWTIPCIPQRYSQPFHICLFWMPIISFLNRALISHLGTRSMILLWFCVFICLKIAYVL